MIQVLTTKRSKKKKKKRQGQRDREEIGMKSRKKPMLLTSNPFPHEFFSIDPQPSGTFHFLLEVIRLKISIPYFLLPTMKSEISFITRNVKQDVRKPRKCSRHADEKKKRKRKKAPRTTSKKKRHGLKEPKKEMRWQTKMREKTLEIN